MFRDWGNDCAVSGRYTKYIWAKIHEHMRFRGHAHTHMHAFVCTNTLSVEIYWPYYIHHHVYFVGIHLHIFCALNGVKFCAYVIRNAVTIITKYNTIQIQCCYCSTHKLYIRFVKVSYVSVGCQSATVWGEACQAAYGPLNIA